MRPVELISGLAAQVVDLIRRARRMAPGPALIRGGVLVAATAAQLLAWPVPVVLSSGIAVLLGLATVVALFPGGPMPSMLIGSSTVGWLFATASYGEALTVWRLTAVAGALYLVHSLCALAAVVPYDAVVAPGVLRGWLVRAVPAVAAAGVMAVVAAVVQERVGAERYLAASLAGIAVLVALAWYLAGLARARR